MLLKPFVCLFYLFCLFFLLITTCTGNVRLKVDGLSGELEKNVWVRLSSITGEEDGNDSYFRVRVNNAIRQGLRALGYYEPTIKFKIDNYSSPLRPVLYAQVSLGKPVRIAGDNIIFHGGARADEDYLMLVKKGRPTYGEILNHGKYDRFKNSLISLALRKGYFDADILESQLSVADNLHQAFWNINFNSGSRYYFGEVKFKGSQIRADYLQNLVPFHYGDYYNSEDLAELNRRLSATNWFNTVVVSPDFNTSKANRMLPLAVWVTPRPRNILESGLGYASDIGLRLKGSWEKPWLNDRGHSLDSSYSMSSPEQRLDLTYKIPKLHNSLEEYYLLHAGFKSIYFNNTKSFTSKVIISRYWDLSSGWQRVINLTWRLDYFTHNIATNTTMLLYPGFSINQTHSCGGLMPIWGNSQRYSIDLAKTSWRAGVAFALIQAQNVWIRTIADKHRFIAREQVGWIKTNNFNKVPPDLRFFVGGDHSIRGYKYKGISPRDNAGKLIGSSKMLTSSLEYQYNVTSKWWGAIFIDLGEAVNNLRKSNIKTGVGVGMRWQSLLGPLKLDIAVPVEDKETHGVQLYIGLGPEL